MVLKEKALEAMLRELESEPVLTWFDLGLFLDGLKDRPSKAGFNGRLNDFKSYLQKGGLGFITFHFGIDGLSLEIEKYYGVLRQILPKTSFHFIAGDFDPKSWLTHEPGVNICDLPNVQSFDKWPLYKAFFQTTLERGAEAYNDLIETFWKQSLKITESLGRYVIENNIRVLFLANVCSNPGNVSLALATVLISEYLGIPVINNNHDFYWEGGNSPADREYHGAKPGPRDFFFHNSHVGEFFSVIEVLYPWMSRSWLSININKQQVDHVVEVKGHNPASTGIVGTALDLTKFESRPKRDSLRTLAQVADIFDHRVYSIQKVVRNIKEFSKQPFLTGLKSIKEFDFIGNNLVLLQPTRVISRKCIEINFRLMQKLFKQKDFARHIKSNPRLSITILVTGPIPIGQYDYFVELVTLFSDFLQRMDAEYRNRIFLGFLFSEFDKREFRSKYVHPFRIPDLYGACSLVLLPSETEGRGLPIIEAAASGKPIFCRRYEPEEVFAEVIGEHLDEDLRLRVLQFTGKKIPKNLLNHIVNKIFYPQDSIHDVLHNERIVRERYSMSFLKQNLKDIIEQLYYQVASISSQKKEIKDFFIEYESHYDRNNKDIIELLGKNQRHYLPGYHRLHFMTFLKSLIDPSFFRVEEQQIKGHLMLYTLRVFNTNPDIEKVSRGDYHNFFNLVDDIFSFWEGEELLRHDHSMAYRHRNKKHYWYRDYTYHELTGITNLIFKKKINPPPRPLWEVSNHVFFSDWKLAIIQLTNSQFLGIDDREELFRRLKQNLPRGYFPGRYLKYEMEFFVLQPIRSMIGLEIGEELAEGVLINALKNLPKVYIFIHEEHCFKRYSTSFLRKYLDTTYDEELHLLYKHGIIDLVRTKQLCTGFQPEQMGKNAIKVLMDTRKKGGFIITNGQNAAMMTDIVDIDHFHIGQVKGALASRMMGIPVRSGFVQYVPRGVRTCLAYPTPVQTSKDFSLALKGKKMNSLKKKIGEKQLYQIIQKDANENGTPITELLVSIKEREKPTKKADSMSYKYLSGIYKDGMPWSGVLAKVETNANDARWHFGACTARNHPKTVPELVKEFDSKYKVNTRIAWNGGYILNPELVGKLGLPENYIGSPLGLLIMDGVLESPPLFNKPALIVDKNGKIEIRRVSCEEGFTLTADRNTLNFQSKHRNKYEAKSPCFYDLMYPKVHIRTESHIVIRLAGSVVKDIIGSVKEVELIPVGITLSIPKKLYKKQMFQIDHPVEINMCSAKQTVNWEDVHYAVEAGPLLVDEGVLSVDMEKGGWKTENSIKTQAARVDFTDMRGPKIAVGLGENGELLVLMVNGRLRESVGATHNDMGEILLDNGAVIAMGFDPGGSSTLVVDGKTLNITPYNKNYEQDIFSLPSEPRFVSSAIMGWQE